MFVQFMGLVLFISGVLTSSRLIPIQNFAASHEKGTIISLDILDDLLKIANTVSGACNERMSGNRHDSGALSALLIESVKVISSALK